MDRRTLLLASLSIAGYQGLASAEDVFPLKPIKVTTPFAPGSSDLIVRKLGDHIGKRWKQPVVVETRPGAQGTLASKAMVTAKPDGYSLLLGTNSTHAASKYIFKNLGYDPIKDFTPIIQLTNNPQLLVISSDLPVNNLKEFIAYARQNSGRLSFGSGNTGSLVAAEMLKRQAGFEAVAVNYQGNSQAIQDFVAGRLDFMVTDPLIVNPFLQGGKIKVLGITTKERLPNFPNVVPLAEQGLPDFEYASWVGLFAPAGLPEKIADQLHEEFAQALIAPDVVQFLTRLGMLPVRKKRSEFSGFVQEQIKLWEKLSSDAGLVPA
jgi:tripartite-type tricarboxylate transporter receptor subunit TctC